MSDFHMVYHMWQHTDTMSWELCVLASHCYTGHNLHSVITYKSSWKFHYQTEAFILAQKCISG